MKAKSIYFFVCSLLMLSSCTKVDKTLLVNNWVGTSITMDRETVPGDVSEIRLLLNEDGTFRYRDLNGTERDGTYSSKVGVLFLNPTEGEKISWQIKKLEKDLMVIQIEMGIKYFTLELMGTM